MNAPATLRRRLYDEYRDLGLVYSPPDEETEEFIKKVYEDFRLDAELRQKQFRLFNDRSIEEIWSDSLDDYLE